MRPIVVITSNATGGNVDSNVAILDQYGRPEVSLQAVVGGTATYTVQQTLDNPLLTAAANITWFSHPDSTLVNATSSIQGNYAYLPTAVRVRQTAGSGNVTLTVMQAGLHP